MAVAQLARKFTTL